MLLLGSRVVSMGNGCSVQLAARRKRAPASPGVRCTSGSVPRSVGPGARRATNAAPDEGDPGGDQASDLEAVEEGVMGRLRQQARGMGIGLCELSGADQRGADRFLGSGEHRGGNHSRGA